MLSKDPAVLSKNPTVLIERTTVLSKNPTVLIERTTVLSKNPAVLIERTTVLSKNPAVLSLDCLDPCQSLYDIDQDRLNSTHALAEGARVRLD